MVGFFPKHCPFSTLPHYDIKRVETMVLVLLNTRESHLLRRETAWKMPL